MPQRSRSKANRASRSPSPYTATSRGTSPSGRRNHSLSPSRREAIVSGIADRAHVAARRPEPLHQTWAGPQQDPFLAPPAQYPPPFASAPMSPSQTWGGVGGMPPQADTQGDLAALDAARRMRARLDALMGGGDAAPATPSAYPGSPYYPPQATAPPPQADYYAQQTQQQQYQQQQQQYQQQQAYQQQMQQMQQQMELQRQEMERQRMEQQQQQMQQMQFTQSQQPPVMTTMTSVQTADPLGDLTHVHAGFAAASAPDSPQGTELPSGKSRHHKELKKRGGDDDLLHTAFKSAMIGGVPAKSGTMEGRRTLEKRCATGLARCSLWLSDPTPAPSPPPLPP